MFIEKAKNVLGWLLVAYTKKRLKVTMSSYIRQLATQERIDIHDLMHIRGMTKDCVYIDPYQKRIQDAQLRMAQDQMVSLRTKMASVVQGCSIVLCFLEQQDYDAAQIYLSEKGI